MPRSCPRPKGPTNQYFAISRPWGSGRRKHKMQKSCAILGRNFWGRRICSPKVLLAPGNCAFLFSARVLDFSKCPRPRTGQNPSNSPLATTWDRKKVVPEKVAENHPGPRGNIFFRFWDPGCSGARKGPCGASGCSLACLWSGREVTTQHPQGL